MVAEISLSPGETGEAGSPTIISSGGLGPCVAIGVFDEVKLKGYMAHLQDPDQSDELDKFLNYALEETGNRTLTVWVTGAAIENEDDDVMIDEIMATRKYVENELAERIPNSKLTIAWSSDNCINELYLSTSSGEFEVEKLRNDELFLNYQIT